MSKKQNTPVRVEIGCGWVQLETAARLAYAREQREAKTGGYYAGGKRSSIGGAPCKVASWVGELGNDPEYREATKPRTEFKAAYYEGGHRITHDGAPCRVAGAVKDWAPWMKRAVARLSTADERRDQRESDDHFRKQRIAAAAPEQAVA